MEKKYRTFLAGIVGLLCIVLLTSVISSEIFIKQPVFAQAERSPEPVVILGSNNLTFHATSNEIETRDNLLGFLQPNAWVTIMSEDFEGTFPAGGWDVFDGNDGTGGEYYWAKSDCRSFNGSYAGWAVGEGNDGGALACGSNYPDDALSWMVYGPFSLTDAIDAELLFQWWLNTEDGFDELFVGASINGTNFYGSSAGGVYDWSAGNFDLTNVYTLGDLTGEPQVWISFVFYSNSTTNMAEGVYVDDIVLHKEVIDDTSTPTDTPTDTPTSTASPTSSATATSTATPTSSPLPSATGEPMKKNVYLPLLLSASNVEPSPTPIPTTPSPPTQTPTPTATSEGVVPTDGNWQGPLSNGGDVEFTVVNNGSEVDQFILFVHWNYVCGVYATAYYFYDIPVDSGHFYKSRSGSFVSGDFDSPTTASGSYNAVLDTGTCSAEKSGTWTATIP